ncbi:hypothetical protein KIPB_007770, partial [Kipferlia bialata]|eukprot:g7770.t1
MPRVHSLRYAVSPPFKGSNRLDEVNKIPGVSKASVMGCTDILSLSLSLSL